MEELNPTEEQIQKFWFKVGLHCDNIGWYIPINIEDAVPSHYISGLATPEIDLNNLFKWAVLKTIKLLADSDLSTDKEAMYKLFSLWIEEYWTPRNNPISITLALCKAIEKLIDEVKQQ